MRFRFSFRLLAAALLAALLSVVVSGEAVHAQSIDNIAHTKWVFGGDTYETINTEYLASSTRLIVAAVGDLALQVPPPATARFQSHENFPQRERHFHTGYDMHTPLEN